MIAAGALALSTLLLAPALGRADGLPARISRDGGEVVLELRALSESPVFLAQEFSRADQTSAPAAFLDALLAVEQAVRSWASTPNPPSMQAESAGLLDTLERANIAILAWFGDVEQKCLDAGLAAEVLARHHAMVSRHALNVGELSSWLRQVADVAEVSVRAGALAELTAYFEEHPVRPPRKPISAGLLPVRAERRTAPTRTREQAGELPAAGRAAAAPETPSNPTPADLAPTVDVQITQEIQNLADGLGNAPVPIYEYVRNNFAFDPYLGSRRGSAETLRLGMGGDYDLASLLIALLRASGIPARYATGIVEMPADRARSWLGVEDGLTAASILTTAGMEGVGISDGQDIVAVECRRVWVEAWVPYARYRGAGVTTNGQGAVWVPLDPAFKQNTSTGQDIPEEMGFNAEAFVDGYVATIQSNTPLERYRALVSAFIGAVHPELTYQEALRTDTPVSEAFGILPASLPYTLISADAPFSVIPTNKRYRIRFHIHGEGADLDHTEDLPSLVGRTVTYSYIGATPADQQIIDVSGGILLVQTPWLVQVKPVLRVDGCIVATGTGSLTLGLAQQSDLHFLSPEGADNHAPMISNEIMAGTYQGIGLSCGGYDLDSFSSAVHNPACDEEYTGYLVFDAAMRYLAGVDAADREVARSMHLALVNDIADAIVGNVVDVGFIGPNPISLTWQGLALDADRRVTTAFAVEGGGNEDNVFFPLVGADGSIAENRVFEDNFGEEAVSTIKILALANDAGIPVFDITPANRNTYVPQLTHPSSLISVLNAHLDNGLHLTIPRDPLTHFEWTGTGYIVLNPADYSAAYDISGGYSGGQTVKEWDYNPNAICTKAQIQSHTPNRDEFCLDEDITIQVTVLFTLYKDDGEGNPVVAGTETKTFSFKPADLGGPGTFTFKAGSDAGGPGPCGTDEWEFTVLQSWKLKFYDQPKRRKSMAPVTWRADLQVVCQSAAGSSTYTALDSITYWFAIDASNNVSVGSTTGSSDISVTSFNSYSTTSAGGLTIRAEYIGCCEDESLRWVQTITTSHPLGGATSPYNDPQPPDDALPYYWTDAELPSYISQRP